MGTIQFFKSQLLGNNILAFTFNFVLISLILSFFVFIIICAIIVVAWNRISLAEVYERVGKGVISVRVKSPKGLGSRSCCLSFLARKRTLHSKILKRVESTLFYTWSLKKVPLSGGASAYRSLCGVPHDIKSAIKSPFLAPYMTSGMNTLILCTP